MTIIQHQKKFNNIAIKPLIKIIHFNQEEEGMNERKGGRGGREEEEEGMNERKGRKRREGGSGAAERERET